MKRNKVLLYILFYFVYEPDTLELFFYEYGVTVQAHAAVYHMYDQEFRAKQGGKIGIVGTCEGYIPKNSDSNECPLVLYEANCGWIFNPIFSSNGDWSDVIKKDSESSKPSLPLFTLEEIQYIKGTSDYVGLTYYTSFACEKNISTYSNDYSSYDFNVSQLNGSWEMLPDNLFPIHNAPEGLRFILNTIKNKYNNPPVYIMENGAPDGELHDVRRIKFLYAHMEAAILARTEDGCNVEKYTIWSFLDGFEWGCYDSKMGLVKVDFDSANFTRTPRLSSKWLRKVMKDRELVEYTEGMEL